MKRRIVSALLALCLACSLGACNGKEEKKEAVETDKVEKVEETEKDPEELAMEKKLELIEPAAYRNAKGLNLEPGSYISVLGKGSSGEYWEEVKKGVKQAEKDLNKELGYEGSDKIKVTYSGPEEKDDIDEQVNILDEEIARYPVAIAIAIADVQACEVQFDLATENGIPLVAFDSGSGYKGLAATVTSENKSAAKDVADALGKEIQKKGKVIMFVHDSKSQAAADREAGFREEIEKKFPDIKIVKTVYTDDLTKTREKLAEKKNAQNEIEGIEETFTADDITVEEAIDSILEKHPDLKGCFATNGDAMKIVLAALERQEKTDVKVVGFDANADEIEALKEGKIQGLMVQNPFGMGYASVIAAARAALFLGNEAFVDTGCTWVTQSNLQTKAVQNILYFN